MNRTPLSSQVRQASGCGKVILPLMGVMFLIAGTAALCFLTLRPMQHWWSARNWIAAECQIIDSQVETRRSSESTNYLPQITYQYEAEGVTRTSSRYSFFEIASSRSWAARIVGQFPKGSRQTCYYDPASPSEAVLVRSASGLGFWFAVGFPWPFIVAGLFLLRLGLVSGRKSNRALSDSASPNLPAPSHLEARGSLAGNLNRLASSRPAAISQTGSVAALPANGSGAGISPTPYSARSDWEQFAGPQKLKPTVSRLGALVGVGFAALFWNGIVSFFVWGILDEKAWFILLFLTPFILVGLALIGAFFYTLLALFNPKVELALSEGAVTLGESIDVAWEVSGWVERIREFSIVAVGEEVATYTRGTDTRTDTQVFQSIEVVRVTDPEAIRFGTAVLEVPRDTMHSHAGKKNKIVWTLRVQGKIPRFPDVNEHYQFRVVPLGVR